MTRSRAVVATVLAIAAIAASMGSANAGVYVGGGTVVFKEQGQGPKADNGTLVCSASAQAGIGGACLPFGAGDFVEVLDAVNGHDVAFQVCVDANGDGICSDAKSDPAGCNDLVFFSHDDEGVFHNPLGPLPTSKPCGPTAGGWDGYVVFLCEGVHVAQTSTGAPGAAHTHTTTTGTIGTTTADVPSGFGDFCGSAGNREPVRKPYTVVS